MFFSWLFFIVSFLSLLLAKYFSVLAPDTEPLLLTLLIMVGTPHIIPIIHSIKKDIMPLHNLTSKEAFGWYSIMFGVWILLTYFTGSSSGMQGFVMILLFAIYFHLDARVFFLGALSGLLSTIFALVVGMDVFAEQASIFVYLMLVLGVITELVAPVFDRFHRDTRSLFHFPVSFISEYRRLVADYSVFAASLLGLLVVMLIVGRGFFWEFDFSMLIFFAIGQWIFLMIGLSTMDKDIRPVFFSDLIWTEKFEGFMRYGRVILCILWASCIMVLVDVAYFRALPLYIQILGGILTIASILSLYMAWPRMLRSSIIRQIF